MTAKSDPPAAVLFDLDGTLADTAEDLTAALNSVLAQAGRAPLPLETTRPLVSRGALALLRLGFDIDGSDPRMTALRESFLDFYGRNLSVSSCLFPGIADLLRRFQARGIPFGVVTNKPRAYTEPLLAELLPTPPASVVCGDDLAVQKPHPAPLLLACRQIGVRPFQCVFIGDDRRDVVAGLRAGMTTIVAAYGYIGPGEQPMDWGARHVADAPEQIAKLIL